MTNSIPFDHTMGPWCPTNVNDDKSKGGIWLKDNGDIFVTSTKADCENAVNPNVGAEYKNFCVECLPSYITAVKQSYLIPMTRNT